MNNDETKWDTVPEEMTLDQFRTICHISKSTARFLLKSGKVPCVNTGKKTRCYKIKKTDVQAYYEDRKEFPEFYMVTKGWYAKNAIITKYGVKVPVIREDMHDYYTFLLKDYPDVLNNSIICKLTGYSKTAINNWCFKNHLKHFCISSQYMIPKVYLVDFFCSKLFRGITRKSDWHKTVLIKFSEWKLQHQDEK